MTATLALPDSFRRIHLELAREHDHPEGSAAIRYEFAAPLTDDGRIDPTTWKQYRDHCRVVRSRPDEERRVGHLVRRPGGSWAFRYDQLADEAGHHFDDERFTPGEYVSLRENDESHTFKVVSVQPL